MGQLVSMPQIRKRCGEPTAKGTECTRYAVAGQEKCFQHGGVAKATQLTGMSDDIRFNLELAKNRVAQLAPLALQTVMEILQDPDAKTSDRLKAAGIILDRTVSQKIEVQDTSSDERDIDAEIEEALEIAQMQLGTGTDG